MLLYNTLTRKKEVFEPLVPNRPTVYACGPTVYNYIHIGNARPICVFDVLRRYLEYRGMEVAFIQNFTDIDDKLINRANTEGTTVASIAKRYIDEYFIDSKGLNVREATVHPLATENVDEIFNLITSLIEKGFAYEANGDVYFRTHRFDEYGKLSRMPLEDLEEGLRVEVGDQKENPADFALWKAAKPNEPMWDSPWGKGRPGWHIECSAMAKRYLGKTIDIHCGGQDLIFPHHENEIAQSECANGAQFARFWLHNGYINVDNKKMSKSFGNFFTVREVASKYGYEPIRYMMIASHYRSPINYSYEVIEQCRASLERLYNCRENLVFVQKYALDEPMENENKIMEKVISRRQEFIEAMDDDLNTAGATGVLFELARDINIFTASQPSKKLCETALTLFDELCDVLGILYCKQDESLDSKVEEMIKERVKARAEKDYARADRIRDELKQMGIILEDTPQGIKWRWEK